MATLRKDECLFLFRSPASVPQSSNNRVRFLLRNVLYSRSRKWQIAYGAEVGRCVFSEDSYVASWRCSVQVMAASAVLRDVGSSATSSKEYFCRR
jgi:hypothetical protein